MIFVGGIGSWLWLFLWVDVLKFLYDLIGLGYLLLCDIWDCFVLLVGVDWIVVVIGCVYCVVVEVELLGIVDFNVFFEFELCEFVVVIGFVVVILYCCDLDVIIGLFSVDYVICSIWVFEFVVCDVVEVVCEGYICMIGIMLIEFVVGFGYIKMGFEFVVDGVCEVVFVVSFVEKFDFEIVKEYFVDCGYFWNVGMFIVKVGVFLEEIVVNELELYVGLFELVEVWDDCDWCGLVVDWIWLWLKKIVIDYVVVEFVVWWGKFVVVFGYFDWDDVGDFVLLIKFINNGRKNDLVVFGLYVRVFIDGVSGIFVS